MVKKAHLIKASVLNGHSADKSGALFFIYASANRSINKAAEFAKFKCGQCNTEFAALKGTEPYCVTCGDEDVYEDDGQELEVESYKDEDKELASITCSGCDTHNILKLETAAALGSVMHCVTCSKPIDFQAPVLASEDDDMGDALQDSFEDTLEGGDEDVDFTESEILEDDDAPAEPETETTEEVGGDDEPSDSENESEDNSNETPEGVENTEDSDSGETEEEEEDFDDFEEETLAKLIGKGNFHLDRVSDVLVASVNSIPVATLAKADAGDNEKYFHSTEFASAIKHTVKQSGIEGLNDYGFSFAKVKIPVKEILSKRVNAGVQKEIAAVNTKLESLTDDFEQCLGIALSALNKNFFNGKSNPLREGFIAQLETANVRGASRIVDNVFKAFGKDMHRAAFELAKDIMSKSPEYRAEIASAVGEANYQETDAEDDDSAEDLGSRLEGAGIKSKVEVASTQKVTKSETQSVTAHKGVEIAKTLERVRKLSGTGSLFLNR